MTVWRNFQNLIRWGAKADILFFTLPWLMVLVVLGTISQKNVGLYEAVQTYFHSIILWLGPVPTPGGLLIIGLIFISLSIKFLFYSPWRRDHAGIILTHLGILLLLFGGLITVATSKEGFLLLAEGTGTNMMADYRQRVLTIQNDESEKIIPFDDIEKNQIIHESDFTITVLDACENCSARAPTGIYDNLQGLAQNMEIFSIPSEQNKEMNFSGAVISITGSGETDGTYIIMEDIPKTPEIKGYRLFLGRAQTPLPFTISLQDFRKINHPGTGKAKEFESDILVQDGNVSWPATIRMNEPLRYKGYTFYQSSFEQRDGIEVSVLNVVKNTGRFFPYLSCLVIFCGLLLHFILRVKKASNKESGVS